MAKKINIVANLIDKQFKKQLADIENGKYKVDVDVDGEKIGDTSKTVKRLGNTTASTNSEFKKLKDTISNTFSAGKIAMTGYLFVLNAINKAGQNAKQTIKDLDESITNLSVAMGEGRNVASNYLSTLNEQAKEIGATTKETANSADSWIRQGKSLAETEKLVYDSMILSKLGKIESADASTYLTAALNGYKLEAESAIDVVDKLTAVDMESASDAGGLAESLSKTSSAANMAGVSFNKLIGMIATVKEVTQDSDESVGNMFKSIFSRMNQIKAGKFVDLETGESLNDTEKVLNNVGISMRNANNEFISSEKILDEVGAKWKGFDSTTQRAVATAIAGTYQYNRLIALFDNYGDALKYTETAANSAGTAIEKFNDSYMNSLEAKENTLQASFESMVINSDFSEVYAGILDATTALVDFINETNVLKGAMSALAVGGAIKAFVGIKSGINQAYITLNKFQNAMSIVGKTKISTKEYDRLLLLSNGLSQSQMKLIVSTNALSIAQKKELLMASGLSEEESILQLKTWKMTAANNGLTTSTTSANNAFKALWTTIKANPLLLIISSVTLGISVWQKYKQSIEDAVSAASEAASIYKEQTSSIDEMVSKYQDLRGQLIAARGNEEATYDIKQQLLELQKQLNEQFGEEYENLNLVTNAYKDQTEEIKEYNKEVAQKYLNENRKGINEASKQMESDDTYYLGSMNGLVNASELQYLDAIQSIASANNIDFTDRGFEFVGNAKEASESINNFMNQITELQKQAGNTSTVMSSIFDGLLDNSGEALADAESIIDEYSEIYRQSQLAEIASDTNLSSEYSELLDAVTAYNDAVTNSENQYDDENVRNAYDNLQIVKQGIDDNEKEWGKYADVVEEAYNKADISAYSFYDSIDKNKDGIGDLANELKGLSDVDLQSMTSDGDNEDAFDKLCNEAGKYGLEVQDVIDLLIELGYVQGKVQNTISAETDTSFTGILAQVQSLSEGLDQLDKIYADVYNKEDFDWSSILGDTFKETFSECGKAYDDFIETISNSPSDISACQSAFNSLATTYIYQKSGLDNVTESTKAATIAMLEQMGVANASAMVEAKLAAQKEISAIYSKHLTELTYADIAAIILEGEVSDTTAQYLESMAIEKMAVNGVEINSTSDVNNIIAIAKAAGMSAIELARLKNALISLNDSSSTTSNMPKSSRKLLSDGLNPTSKKPFGSFGEKFEKKKKEKENNPLFVNTDDKPKDEVSELLDSLRDEMESLNPADYYADFTGGSVTKNAIEDAASAAKDAAETVQEAVAQTFDFIQNGLDLWERNMNRIKQVAENTYLSLTKRAKAYKDEIDGTAFGIQLLQKDYETYMTKANAVGLDENLAAAVRGGSSDITDITDDNVKQQIQDYESWYDKAQNCLDQIEELKIQLTELKLQKIQLEIDVKADKLTRLESALDKIQGKIDLKETWGFQASVKDYTKMNANLSKQMANLNEQNTLIKQQQSLVEKGSEAWQDYQQSIDSNNASVQSLTQSMAENASALAAIAGEKAASKAEKYDAKTELYDAKIDNAVSAKSQNSLIDKKISAIDNTQKAYDTAVSTDSKSLKKAQKTINKFKSTKENKKVLASIKKYTKSGKRIPQSLLDKASKLNDNGKLYNACVQYNAYYDAKQSDKEIADLYKETSTQEKASLAIDKFNNIAEEYDYKTSANEQKKTSIQNKIALAEEQGKQVSTAYYKSLISAESAEQTKLIQKRDALQQSMNNAVINGSVKKGSEEWYQMVDAINEVTNAIGESTQSLVEYQNTMRQLKWDAFDKALETIQRINNEADYYINLMSNKDMVDEETGNFTQYGVATLGLHKTNYETYLAQADAYQKEYNSIMSQISAGELSLSDENVIQRLRDLQDAHRDAMLSAEDELQSINDLVKQGYETQTNALSELIDKYKKLKDSALDAYNYQKQIEEKTKNIASLQKQLAAYGGNDSEESRAQIQKLKVELQDAKDDLKDTEYEKYISDTEEMLDELFNDFEEFLDEKLNDTNSILDNISSLLGDSGSIVTTLLNLDSSLTTELQNIVTGVQNIPAYINSTVANAEAAANEEIQTADSSQTQNTTEQKNVTVEKPASSNSNELLEQARSELEKTQKERAIVSDFVARYGEKATKKKSEYTPLNQAIYTAYNKKVLPSRDKLKALANKLNIKYDNSKKSGTLYKKLKELGIKGFSVGSKNIPNDMVALLGEEGAELQFDKSQGVLRQVGEGDKVFTNEMAENLWKISQMNPSLLSPNITLPSLDLPTFENTKTQPVSIDIGDIIMNGVNDVETFGKQLREEICKNGKTTQCIAEAVSAKQLGKSGIGDARRYK